MWFIGRIISRPKTCWPRNFPLVRWYVHRTMKASAARITMHGLASSTDVSCRLYVCTRFPSTWCILSMVEFECGLPEESRLVLIAYFFSIKFILNSWLSNYPSWSYVIYSGHGYRTSHVVSTKFSIFINFLSLYCIISNHLLTGSIIVTNFNIRASLIFIHIYRGLWYLHIVFPRYFLC